MGVHDGPHERFSFVAWSLPALTLAECRGLIRRRVLGFGDGDYREIRYEVEEQIEHHLQSSRASQSHPVGMLDEVQRAVRGAQQDDAVQCHHHGEGRAFCSGGDVKSMAQVASAGGSAVSARQERWG
jgi:hypothetical protein